MFIIGLTGGLGTGKTTVASLFSKKGAKVLDADKMAHRLMEKEGTCFDRILKYFGGDILTKGCIDRKKLSGIVFNNATGLKKLEKIIHPEVIKEMKKEISRYERKKNVKTLVLDVPLLFESGLQKYVDVTVVVKAGQDKQIQRTTKRLALTRRETLRRIHAQMPMREKLFLSDIVIDNSGSINRTKKQVEEIFQKWINLEKSGG